MGRVLAETFALGGGGGRKYAFDVVAASGCAMVRENNNDQREGVPTTLATVTKEGCEDGVPNPFVAVTLRLVLMLSPSDLAGK